MVAGLLLLLGGPAKAAADAAASFPKEDVRPPISLGESKVVDAVTTLMQRYAIPVRRMSEDIEGQVSGTLGGASPGEVLSQLGALYGFYWYYDGGFVEIGPAEEVGAETLRVPPEKCEQFLADLDALGMVFPQFPLSVNETNGVIVLRGPESLRTVIRALAGQYAPDAPVSAPAAAEARPVTLIYGRDYDPARALGLHRFGR